MTTNSSILDEHRRLLQHHFREQQRFAADYSPLYARLFALVAGWLADDADPVAGWLVAASAERPPFDATLLLAAALHHEVLAGEAPDLARFYPTAGGRTSLPDPSLAAVGGRPPAVDFEAALQATILERREALEDFIRRRTVQTNETGRGLCWLLPVACWGWPEIYLVELGASAGLNLVAERRAYRLVAAVDPSRVMLTLAAGSRPQFTIAVRGGDALPAVACCPAILSRTGGDLHPFHLHTAENERVLASFVWADQPARLARLREGVAELHRVERTAAPVRLRPLRLPDDLRAFLDYELPCSLESPAVIFNTTVTMYLPDRGASLREIIGEWAAGQRAPVLWLQWEPPPPGGPQPPEEGWLAWTADYWTNTGTSRRQQWQLGWVHPHGGALELGPDWDKITGITMQI